MPAMAKGYVNELHAYRDCTFVILDHGGVQPKNGGFYLPKGHENFESANALCLAAFVNGFPLTIRVVEAEIKEDAEAHVEYVKIHKE